MGFAGEALAEAGVVTVMSTEPTTPAGAVAVISVAESTVNDVAGVEPKSTADAPPKFVPVMTAVPPPATGPTAPDELGETRPVPLDVDPALFTVNVLVPPVTTEYTAAGSPLVKPARVTS